MEKSDLIIKSVIGVVGGIVSIFTGLFGLMFTGLLGMMAIDYLTGITSSIVFGEGLSSSRGYRGLFKKVYTLILIGSILMVEIAVTKTNGVITDGVSSAFIFIEFISIIENGNKMGLKLGFLNKLVETVKSKIPLLEDADREVK